MDFCTFDNLLNDLNKEIVNCYVDNVDGPVGLFVNYMNNKGETREMTLINIEILDSCHISARVLSNYAIDRVIEITGALDDPMLAASRKYTFSIDGILNARLI